MTFKNECNCIVDKELLSKAVDNYCRRQNVYCNNEHRIVLHNNYPTIVISRKHLYVHDLLRALLFHTRKGYAVHHKDFNKLNNSVENLAYISHATHSRIHAIHNWEKAKADNKKIVREQKRKDIPDEEIKKMLREGTTVREIAGIFKCHHNTIYRRIASWEGVDK